MTPRGLDVSLWQPPDFPWPAAVAWGASFAFIRAGGGYLEDINYERHRTNARAHGLATGAYWALFHHNPPAYEPTIFDPSRQARAFVSLLADDDELPAVVDVEKDGVTDALLWAFVNEFHRLSTRVLMIYTSQMAWYGLIGRGQWRYAVYPLWVTNYNGGALELPDAWQDAGPLFIQDSGTGDIPGYDKNLDLDTFNGSEAEFASLIGKDADMPITLTDAQVKQFSAVLDDLILHLAQIKSQAAAWQTYAQAEADYILTLRPLLVLTPPPTGNWWDSLPAGVFPKPVAYPAQPNPYKIYDQAGVALATVKPRMNAGQFFERHGDLLRVLDTPISGALWWVRAEELTTTLGPVG